MSFAITPEHVAYRKKIGKVGNLPLFEVMTTGGLYMNILGKNGQFEIVGTGSHRAISRYITDKKLQGKVEWTEMSKSDYVPIELIDAGTIQKYEELTDRLRGLQGLE